MHRLRNPLTLPALAVWLLACTAPAHAARDRAPGFLEQSLGLPGMPAAVVSTDMTGDGHEDLIVLVAYTTWDSVSQTEQITFDDIEGLVEVMSVVSALLDRRELRLYPGLEEGGFGEPLPPLEIDTSVHVLQAGDATEPLIAITDDGVAAVRLSQAGDGPRLDLVPLFFTETAFAGSGTFVSGVDLLHDLDGDGRGDLVLPTAAGWSVFRGTDSAFVDAPVARLTVPEPPPEDDEAPDVAVSDEAQAEVDVTETREEAEEEAQDDARPKRQRITMPEARDVDGDGALDLVLTRPSRRGGPVVFRQQDDLSFAAGVTLQLPEERDDEEITWIGDLDGDGRAEAISQQEREPGDEAGFRQEIDHAKRPRFTYRLYALGDDLQPVTNPYRSFDAIGYVFQGTESDPDDEDDVDVRLPGGFDDLDGDGRQDLVAITLDFSIMPLIMRALVFGSISLRMDFHPWCQQESGAFAKVPDLDLSGKFKINFRNVQIKHLSQFAGDFNGDGRKDFVQLGRGKKVTIHQGLADCAYPLRPDRKLRFQREPRHLGLVRIVDLDGDARSDIYVVHPLRDPGTGESIPVRLDLYLRE